MGEYERIDVRTRDAQPTLPTAWLGLGLGLGLGLELGLGPGVRVRSRRCPRCLRSQRSTAAPFRWLWAGSSGGRRRTW